MNVKQKGFLLLSFIMLFGILVGCNNKQSKENATTRVTTTPQEQVTQAAEDSVVTSPTVDVIVDDLFPTDPLEYSPTDATEISEYPIVPYVNLYCNLLDMSAKAYENQTGALFLNVANPDQQYYVRPADATQYYYGTNEVFIAVRNNEICMVLSYVSSSVRDVINKIDATELFEISPAMCKVSNWYNTQNFFYWQIDNGYIGFIAIGGNEPSKCYNYVAQSLIYFEDLDDINVDASISNNVEETVPDSIIEIGFAPEDYYISPENYDVYHFEGLEYGSDVILIPNAEIYDFEFFLLDAESLFMNEEYKIAEILHTSEVISPSKPFITRIYVAGPGGPYYGVSFFDELGNQYSYVIYESGADGSFYLVSF